MIEQVARQQAAEASAEAVHLMPSIEQPVREDAYVFRLGQRLRFNQQAMAVGQIMTPGVVLVLLGTRLQQGAW